jgi:hypothetical protein
MGHAFTFAGLEIIVQGVLSANKIPLALTFGQPLQDVVSSIDVPLPRYLVEMLAHNHRLSEGPVGH